MTGPHAALSSEFGALVDGVLAGNRRALARLITRVENRVPGADAAIAALYPHTGRAAIVGITGAPGTGKSTVVNALTRVFRARGQTVGIVAVDPTSPFSGGAVLGDRIRMSDHAGDAGVFIRSMASRGSLGGLSATTNDVTRILDAAGFDLVLIETVGAGQSEVDIARTAYTTIVVDAPGLGDDVQAIKAGILEIADILVVNKADRPGVENTVRALRAMLDLGHRMRAVPHHGQRLIQDDTGASPEYDFWQVPILKTVAAENEGLDAVADAIAAHGEHLRESGQRQERERQRVEAELIDRLREVLLARLLAAQTPAALADVVDRMAARTLDPGSAVAELLAIRD
ncbi:MAG TPA: methylmalonyl Co-A mutase-associated GTPase MeaB [Aggregatilinea sp.]|uniref:methylmalonyl Co-A mutase-associated GTPase MeaB n=1 Tax=Aggregatilinea sp. TaxID=2806333 RepID=UPI002BF2E9B2|nr:methylmalonyl Co-A mutase-associated GTPase MeaB [Aggregatilinea sp.]HML23910.1 methylmalonyl Co-A mutase-associated GTPase MeaB [Aggregatilinea sp.]